MLERNTTFRNTFFMFEAYVHVHVVLYIFPSPAMANSSDTPTHSLYLFLTIPFKYCQFNYQHISSLPDVWVIRLSSWKLFN